MKFVKAMQLYYFRLITSKDIRGVATSSTPLLSPGDFAIDPNSILAMGDCSVIMDGAEAAIPLPQTAQVGSLFTALNCTALHCTAL